MINDLVCPSAPGRTLQCAGSVFQTRGEHLEANKPQTFSGKGRGDAPARINNPGR